MLNALAMDGKPHPKDYIYVHIYIHIYIFHIYFIYIYIYIYIYINRYGKTNKNSHNLACNYKMLQRKHLQIGSNHILNNRNLIIHVGAFNPNKQVPNCSKTGFFAHIYLKHKVLTPYFLCLNYVYECKV